MLSPDQFADLSGTSSGARGMQRSLQADVRAGIGRYQREQGLPQVHTDTSRTVVAKGSIHKMGAAYPTMHLSGQDPDRVKASYAALSNEIGHQFDFMTRSRAKGGMGLDAHVQPVDPYGRRDTSQPYADKADLIMPDTIHDVSEHHRIQALDTNTTGGTESLSNDTNNMLRVVHDYMGHMGAMRGVDMHGEEAAYQSHADAFSPLARPALSHELRMQNAYLHHSGNFPDQPKRALGYTGRNLSPEQFGEDRGALEAEAKGEQEKQGMSW